MCLNPRRIVNKGFDSNDPSSPYFVVVPCGKCKECTSARVQEVLFRADWQNTYCRSKHGISAFVTLTFNEESLNYVNIKNDKGQYIVSTWNNKKLKNWLQSLQMFYYRKDIEVKYLVSCERGGSGRYLSRGRVRFRTSRPHYHVQLWLTPKFYNEFNSVIIDKQELWLKCAQYWSWDPKVSSAIEKRFSDDSKTNVRFEATIDPVGYVYNEEIDRTESQATKYVVSYCIKDSAETVLNIDEKDIVSSTFPLSFLQMKPRLFQSQELGIEFIRDLPACHFERRKSLNGVRTYNTIVVDDPKYLASFLNHMVTATSDGQTCYVPRYYIKKMGQYVSTIKTDVVTDYTKVYSEKGYDYKFNCPSRGFLSEVIKPHVKSLSPLSVGDLLDMNLKVKPKGFVYGCFPDPEFFWYDETHYRIRKYTKTIKTDFGKFFNRFSRFLRSKEQFEALKTWITTPFAVETNGWLNLPWFSTLGKQYKERLNRISDHYSTVRDNILRSIGDLSQNVFMDLAQFVLHADTAQLITCKSGRDFGYVPFSIKQVVAYNDFMTIHSFNMSYIKYTERIRLENDYKNNIVHSINTRPETFASRIE